MTVTAAALFATVAVLVTTGIVGYLRYSTAVKAFRGIKESNADFLLVMLVLALFAIIASPFVVGLALRYGPAVLIAAIVPPASAMFLGQLLAWRRHGKRGLPQTAASLGWPEAAFPSAVVFQSVWLTSDEHLAAMGQGAGLSSLYPSGYPQMWGTPLAAFSRGRLAIDERGLRFAGFAQAGGAPKLKHMRDSLDIGISWADVLSAESVTSSQRELRPGATRITFRVGAPEQALIFWVADWSWSPRVAHDANAALLQAVRDALDADGLHA